jgi:DNA-binding HxlR family transcriptional regulator
MDDDVASLLALDRLIHEPARLVLMALLAPLESADFLFLLRETEMTKGNLSSHLIRLEEGGYVSVEKTYQGKTPQTIYRLTDAGRTAWEAYQQRLRRFVHASSGAPPPIPEPG